MPQYLQLPSSALYHKLGQEGMVWPGPHSAVDSDLTLEVLWENSQLGLLQMRFKPTHPPPN